MTSILFITAHRLGDAVITTAALSGLMERYPEARFTIVCGAIAQEIFEDIPQCERVIALHKRSFNRHWLWLWWHVVRRRWDVVVDMRSSAVAYGLWAKKRYVVQGGRREGMKVQQHARSLGFIKEYLPQVWLSDTAKLWARGLLPQGREWVALAPTAGTESKMWPSASFAALAEHLQKRGLEPVIFYGPGEREERLAQPLCEALPNALNMGGCYGVREVAALLACCRLFVGNDSGLMHLSAAGGVPTLGLFGPSCASQYAPSGRWADYVVAPGEEGCGEINQLEVESVLQAAITLCERSKRDFVC